MLRKWSVFHKRCSVIGADNSGLCRYREPPQHSAVSIDTHGQIAHARSLGARHGSEWHGETRDTNYWITREENEHKTSSSSRCRAGEIRLDKYIYIYIQTEAFMCVYKELFLLFFSQHSYLHLHELFPFQIWREMMHFIYKKKEEKRMRSRRKRRRNKIRPVM